MNSEDNNNSQEQQESSQMQKKNNQQNDYFKRQKAISGWNQDKILDKTVLVLGAGGLGSCVTIQLLRLGFKKIMLVDYDVVDDHNMNRQIMYTIKDIGKNKVDQAIQNLAFHNIGNTEIVGHHINAVQEWNKIVELAKESQYIFNLIDYGDYFDIAVSSLCIQLSIPLFQGGTFCNSLSVDYFPAAIRPCLLCLTDGLNKTITDQLHPSLILSQQSLDFIPKNNNPEGQSNIVICQMCANFMNTFLLTEIFPTSPKKASRLLLYLDPIDIVQFDLEINEKCSYCREPYHEKNASHEVKSGDIPIKAEDIWKSLKKLEMQMLFPGMIKEIKILEGVAGQIDSKYEIYYKDCAKWTIKLVEISNINMSISYEIINTTPKYPCNLFRYQLTVSEHPTLPSYCQISWKTLFLEQVTQNAYLDSQFKKQEYLADLIQNINSQINLNNQTIVDKNIDN